jgi:hypothetical protein
LASGRLVRRERYTDSVRVLEIESFREDIGGDQDVDSRFWSWLAGVVVEWGEAVNDGAALFLRAASVNPFDVREALGF